MTSLRNPFASAAALEHRFAEGLAAMLAGQRGLGVYILVLANARLRHQPVDAARRRAMRNLPPLSRTRCAAAGN